MDSFYETRLFLRLQTKDPFPLIYDV